MLKWLRRGNIGCSLLIWIILRMVTHNFRWPLVHVRVMHVRDFKSARVKGAFVDEQCSVESPDVQNADRR